MHFEAPRFLKEGARLILLRQVLQAPPDLRTQVLEHGAGRFLELLSMPMKDYALLVLMENIHTVID